MISAKDAREAVITNGWMNHEVKKYLLSLIRAEEERNQVVNEGDVVKIADKVFIVAKIFDFTDYTQINDYNTELLAVLYDPIRKDLGFAWESLYSDPNMCSIISHVDPKRIFREDIKI